MLACPKRHLPHSGRGLPHGIGDLAVRHVEDLAQHEDRPLRWLERFEHGQHRDRDALGELDVLSDIGASQWFWQPLADVVLAAARRGSHLVERLARDDADEVGPRVAHLRVMTSAHRSQDSCSTSSASAADPSIS